MPFHVYVETHTKIKVCVKLGMMIMQTNVEMTAAHMNYRVSKTLIFKWQGHLREGRESLNDDSGPLMWDDIIWLNLYCPYKQGRCPISGSANDIGCFQTAFTDISLKSGIFLQILSFSESRKYDLLEQRISFKPDIFWSAPRYTGWSCWKVCKFEITQNAKSFYLS